MKGKYKDLKGVTIPAPLLERYSLYRTRDQLGDLVDGVLSGLGLIDPICTPKGEIGTDIENALIMAIDCAEAYYNRRAHADKLNEARRNKKAESENRNNQKIELYGEEWGK